MRVTRTAALVSSDEHGIMMRRVLIEHLFPRKIRNYIRIQPARFKKIRKYAMHIYIRNVRCEGLLLG